MAQTTYDAVIERCNALERQVNGLALLITDIKNQTNSKVGLADMSNSEITLKALISDQGQLINNIEEKLATVIIPDETRYYLEESEVSDFRSNFNKLMAMMASFQELYDNLVAYTSNNT